MAPRRRILKPPVYLLFHVDRNHLHTYRVLNLYNRRKIAEFEGLPGVRYIAGRKTVEDYPSSQPLK